MKMVEKQKVFNKILDIAKIQLLICFFSIISILSKTASSFDFLSTEFILIYTLTLVCFAIYAFFWQRVLKKHSLFQAYSNRAFLVVYALVWGTLLFSEEVTIFNIVGIILIVTGIFVVYSDDK